MKLYKGRNKSDKRIEIACMKINQRAEMPRNHGNTSKDTQTVVAFSLSPPHPNPRLNLSLPRGALICYPPAPSHFLICSVLHRQQNCDTNPGTVMLEKLILTKKSSLIRLARAVTSAKISPRN